MPAKKKTDIGFNRLVRRQWLWETLRQVAAEIPETDIASNLKTAIAEENAGKETIRKVFVHLRRVWIEPPAYCRPLRDSALELFRQTPDERTAYLLNWGMCIAAYPFIGAVAEATGRLFRLQGDAGAAQVNLRVLEQFGDRHFVHRSIRYNLSTFLDMGTVSRDPKTGKYIPGKPHPLIDSAEIAWLVEALLHSRETPSLALDSIATHATLFPFQVPAITVSDIRTSDRLKILRQDLDRSFVELRGTA